MQKPLLLAGLALLLTNLKAQSQVLNWATSFFPSWINTGTTGSAPNIGGSGISSNVDIQLTGGSFTYANGVFGVLSPTVAGATATVPGSSSRMQVAMNFANRTNTCTIKYTFTSQVTNVSFRIADIDKLSANSENYIDQLTITGKRGSTTFTPTITKYDPTTDPNFLIITGNTVHANPNNGQSGNTDSDATDQRGTVTVNFGSNVINEITIVYGNHPNTQNNPGVQYIAIGNISFSASTLPVQLSAFSGVRQSQDVLLSWKTQQETNTRLFEVERNSGNDWHPIGTVNAAGNSSVSTSYAFTDIAPQGATLLYRLKQVDIDNNFRYSGVVRITSKDTKTTLTTYPNPFTEQVNLNINSQSKQQASVSIYDVSGRAVKTQYATLSPGNNSCLITGLDRFSTGTYYIQVKDKDGMILGRTTILKE